MSSEQTGWDHRYRRLSEGETILPTDECQNDDGGWKVTRPEVAGSNAPNPDYTSHRAYRRLAAAIPPPASADALGEVERVARVIEGALIRHGVTDFTGTLDDATAALSAMSPAGEVERLRAVANGDHKRGCQGREYTCTCGFDDERDNAEQRGYDRAIAEVVAWLRAKSDEMQADEPKQPDDLHKLALGSMVSAVSHCAKAIEAGEHKP